MTNPTPMDADYYPRIKIRNRWMLIVPEYDPAIHDSPHHGCEYYDPGDEYTDDHSHCKLIAKHGSGSNTPEFKRHDCGDHASIFIKPSKFPEYRAHLVAKKLEGNT